MSAVLFDPGGNLTHDRGAPQFLRPAPTRSATDAVAAQKSGTDDCGHADLRDEFITHSPTCIPLLDFVEMI
jgi:hypothetical protein